MFTRPWLLTVLALLAAYNTGTVWLAQISGYPLWTLVGRGDFLSYYAAWSRSAALLISAPLLVALAGTVAALWLHTPGTPVWILWTWLALQTAIVALTFCWWTPSAAQLTAPDGSLNLVVFAQLKRSHWLRVALTTIYASICWWVLGHTPWLTRQGPSRADHWLLLLTVAFAFYGVGQIWMVQMLCYRVWPYVGESSFYDYHVAWWHSIWTVIFIPAGLTLIGSVALLCWRPPQTDMRLVYIGVGCQALLYLLTAVWWGPLMGRLATRAEGLLMQRYDLLMNTHWLRVAIVTAYGFVVLWALIQTAASSGGLFSRTG
jgi:hypothetical protein